MTDCVNLFQYAKGIREVGEPWKECVKRAHADIKSKGIQLCKPPGRKADPNKKPRTKSACAGVLQEDCNPPCKWIGEYATTKGKRKAHCTVVRTGEPKVRSACQGVPKEECVGDCSWVKETVTKKGQKRVAHCSTKRVGTKPKRVGTKKVTIKKEVVPELFTEENNMFY